MITQEEYRFIQYMEEQSAEDSADPQKDEEDNISEYCDKNSVNMEL